MRDFSVIHSFVRARQLEGSFPGDAGTGVWPISDLRIKKGWGIPPEWAWPYPQPGDAWPPAEPEGVDGLAKAFRISCYWRRRGLDDCRLALSAECPVLVFCDFSDDWKSPPGGAVPMPAVYVANPATHAVMLVGYDDSKRRFSFQNSWGADWGAGGFGSFSFDYFEKHCWEAWSLSVSAPKVTIANSDRGRVVQWTVDECGTFVHGIELVEAASGDPIAWAFGTENEDHLEVDELFVMPAFRRKGLGGFIAEGMNARAAMIEKSVRFWVSYADDKRDPENLPLMRVLSRYGLVLQQTTSRFASRVSASKTSISPADEAPPRPARPCAPVARLSLLEVLHDHNADLD